MNPKVDFYFAKSKKWKPELEQLRKIALACELDEELKWGVPCYTFQAKNIVLIHDFKEYCALLFFKGVLLKDPKNIMVQQTKNVQSARQLRFTSVGEINKLKKSITAYIFEAVEIEESGKKVEFKQPSEFTVAEEFQKKLDKNKTLRTAFESLTPGRQRGYLLHFSAPKQSKTREARIEKCSPMILSGKGLND